MQRLFDKKSPSDSSSDLNELERTKLFLSRYDPNDQPCQRCGKTCWACQKSASYKRKFVWPKNGKPACDIISVPVFLCEKCGKDELGTGTVNGDYHHAILKGNIIPFSSFTLSFVLAVLYAYVHRTDTVQKVCEFWGISVNTLYAWKKRYQLQYDAWADSLHSLQHFTDAPSNDTLDAHPPDSEPSALQTECSAIAASLDYILQILKDMISGFFNRFTFSFLQGCKRTHLRELPLNRRPRI